ncbi:MAG TPA: cytochrome c oxidase subunit 3 [Arsenicitalea sp.]|nr:cytochrome c oxidase subunit 3 [Arsenicitalea sp.]
MTAILVFLAVVAAVGFWWLAHQRLLSKPWLEQGVIGDSTGIEGYSRPAVRVGLGLFLAVVGSLFALLIAAYFIREDGGDWQPLPVPAVLWFNTGLLVLASAALEWALRATRRGDTASVNWALVAASGFGLAFVAGQLFAWQILAAQGYFLAANPANSFFYLITGLHGLHVIGGIVALSRVTAGAWTDEQRERVDMGVELCTTYWLFMLFVWVILFSLLTGGASQFIDICRQLLS